MGYGYTVAVALQRAVLPTVLVLSALFRPVGISFVYLLMFFLSPFVPVATSRNFKGSVTAYLIILIALSIILILCHIGLQVIIIVLDIDTLFGTCSFTEQLLRHVGFVDFRNLNAWAIIEWLAPDVLIFITSLSVYFATKKLIVRTPPPVQLENGHADTLRAEDSDMMSPTTIIPTDGAPDFATLKRFSPFFCLAALFFAAVLRPSVPGGLYFLVFLISGTYWATSQTLQRGFGEVLRIVMAVIVLQGLCIVAYQTPWMQEHLSSDSLISRLIGLEPLATSTCANDIRIIVFDMNYKLDSYLNPVMLFFAFYVLALTTTHICQPTYAAKPDTAFGQQIENGSKRFNRQLSMMTHTSHGSKKDSWTRTQRLNVSLRRELRPAVSQPTETTPLVRRPAAYVETSDISLAEMSVDEEEESSPSLIDQISYGIVSTGGFIYQNSYIFTNILMMAWSIVYHSWLTFVLLLWANVLWMFPNQRKAMMRSSPFVVIYAELLLIAQYIYGMNLKNSELPSNVKTAGINLSQIGLHRPQEGGLQPCVPLIVKAAFLLMFWVTLRQFFKEKAEKRQQSGLAHMIKPVNLLTVTDTTDAKKSSKFLKKAGDIIKNLLVRLWIWLLVLVIFLCAITGRQMTGFRICYMALFLFFLLVFQSSSKAWVKVMYGFWLFLIFYAMSILILIYTYQFDKFDQYWYDYLNISKTLQSDIGLERYKTKDLFLHLLSPTLIVILTVIQVHYFHKRFIASLAQDALRNQSEPSGSKSNKSSHSGDHHSEKVPDITEFEKSIRHLVRTTFKKVKQNLKRGMRKFKNIFWRFLELHFIKAVYISAFVCSVSEVCLLHVPFVGLCILGIVSRSSVQVFLSRIVSLIVTIIILAKMIYQIAYLDHTLYDVECADGTANGNNAIWFGVQKAPAESGGLMRLLKLYIIYMVMVTLHAVITLRQFQMRTMLGEANSVPIKILFPKITRANADKNLTSMIQYLFNYGYYKFGLEISLIALVSTITYRQDIVAILYAAWLVMLLCCSRSKCAKIWSIFQLFICISLIVQYIVLVGLPPNLCLKYPWLNHVYSYSIQRWAMLPGDLQYNHVPKLIFDFILLLFVNRQKRVFVIESHVENYSGGNNKSVVNDIANLGHVPFENPTRDFLSNVRNYLDIFKNIVLCGFYWVTLAVVFLAGTNFSDLIALGYLVGAFIFLWQGSDFYLQPIKTIIRRWNWLIIFNVANIVIKTYLQIAGCLFMEEFNQNACWLVHILGIACAADDDYAINVEDNLFVEEEIECPATNIHKYLLWDAICFAFLIFQMRIFKSHYFCHIIIDTGANNILASRGADIIEELRYKQIEHRQEHERDVLHKIKRKMEKIRATQQKMIKPNEKASHYEEYSLPVLTSRGPKKSTPTTHPQAVRAGDYYMFEDVDEKFELDLIEDEPDFLEESTGMTDMEKKMSRRKTLIGVWKELQNVEQRRRLYMRQRSYASAPGSSIGIKIDEVLLEEANDGATKGGARLSTHSEPTEYAHHQSADDEDYLKEVKPEKPAEEQPSTSRDVQEEESVTDSKRRTPQKVEVADKESDDNIQANPIVRLLEGFLVSLALRLNRFSRNYRYVNKILAEEKKVLKEPRNVHVILRRTGAAAMFSLLKKNIESDERQDAPVSPSSREGTSDIALKNLNISQQNNATTSTTTPTLTTTNNESPQEQEQQQQQEPHEPQHVVDIIEMPLDTIDAKNARQEPISSTVSIKGRKLEGSSEIRIRVPSHHRTYDGSGSLSKQWSYERVNSASEFIFDEDDFAARDHNVIIEVIIAFWFALLSNTDLICYIVVFINQVVNSSLISLPLPIMVFLWGSLSLPRPTKTFWVTMIAYTQAIVFIKCISQFKLIWAKLDEEINPNYATYDLLLLLVLFFHRFLLKSQGLWKSKYKEDRSESELIQEETQIQNQQLNQENQQQQQQQQRDKEERDNEDSSSRQAGGETLLANDNIESLKRTKYLHSLRKFFLNLVRKSRLPSDVYALMFLCDFINFFVLLFGFTAFGSQQTENDGGVQRYLAENKVPIPFLIMLLVQFILIVIDRALYLRKALVNKIIFHFISVIGIHIWMFFIVPAVTERSFTSLAPPIIFYIIKCFYLLFSSYQIKCGYPKRILGNFLTKGFSLANMILFKVYMQMPFLYELRTILDWVCTDTTMTLFDWLKMEDIFADIYFIKCSRQMETDFPMPRAMKKALISKLLMGGIIILLIVVSIWGPLCLFALGNAVGQSNVPIEVSVVIHIGPYDPIYARTNRESVTVFNERMYADMKNAYARSRSATTFLSSYDAEDIAAVKLMGNAPSLWGISPPDKERLLSDLKNNVTLTARFSYSFVRTPPARGQSGVAGAEVTYNMNDISFDGREGLISMLEGKSAEEIVVISNMVPKFIKILNAGEVDIVNSLIGPENDLYRPLVIKINAVNGTTDFWWEINDYCVDEFYVNTLSKLPLSECKSGIVMYTFNDKKFPSTFSFLTAGGIIGLYTTFVLLASRFLKSFISGQTRKIMFEDLPYVDRVLQLCLDIYLVREALEFALEEDLFAKLIFLYRSPETMIKWTRPKEEIHDDETDTESVRSRARIEHQ